MPSIRHFINAATAGSVALLLTAVPARATGEVYCTAMDGSGAEIHMVIGHLPVLHVVNATASDGVETWTTLPVGDARQMVFGQGFMDDRQLLADFTDPNVEGVVVSLRLFHLSSKESFAEAGVLIFDIASENATAFPVQCENG